VLIKSYLKVNSSVDSRIKSEILKGYFFLAKSKYLPESTLSLLLLFIVNREKSVD